MEHWEYIVFSEVRQHPELGRYDTYGIQVYSDSRLIICIHDVTTDQLAAAKIAKCFTQLHLSPIHFDEAIEDMLAM